MIALKLIATSMALTTALFLPMACTSLVAGSPVPRAEIGSAPQRSSTMSAPSTQRSLDDLAMCDLLTLADLPIRPDRGGHTTHEPRDKGDACVVTVQMSDAFSILTVKVSRNALKFSDYTPPSVSPNGKFIQIGGRRAWSGNPVTTGSDKYCFTAFGAADGYISLTILDETKRGVAPCDTDVGLAEKVVSRTPEPYE
ncbi:MAG TPA: hypothetical protein VGR06_40515 [Actinophytocola sp.]|jgi:hypothetical protein|uniref:hypothetical protein n=1 Tax=Actinophytocola sp. TaxID=1872138 RepID=UPI002E0C1DB8|nr:hypothetical protein [Actinophytocola sp.]